MLFNVVTLLREPAGASREYDVDEDTVVDGNTVRLAGHVRLDHTPRGVLVRARLAGQGVGECSRCLGVALFPIDLTIEEEYIPTIDVNSGARVELQEGDTDPYRINDHHEVDLREAVAQYWAMALPMAPLCRADCPGLCPDCGAPIDDAHACRPPVVDERWAKLTQFSTE